MFKTAYEVTWTDQDGQRQKRTFFKKANVPMDRQPAVLFLNHLILDCGFHDAKRRTVKGAKA